MANYLSQRVNKIKPSPTLAVTSKAQELRAAGRKVIGLGAGEPDFDTPKHIKQAAMAAINSGFTKYTAVDGILSLKEAIVNKLKKDNKLTYKPEQILVSCGAKHSIYNLFQAVLNPGDEVLIPAPYWVSYPDMSILADAKPVIINTGIEQNFKITPEQLKSHLTDKTKIFILNTPSNPTGVAYSFQELQALGKVLKDYPNVIIASDDIYEHILWANEPFANIVMANPELYERTVVINGVSKAYAMTGWRIGYAAGALDIIKAMKKIQGQSTSNPTSISQYAAESALNGGLECLQPMLKAFKERHDFVVGELNTISGVKCLSGDGAFYAFPDVRELINKISGVNDDAQFSEYLLNNAEIAVVPGSAFGANGYVRLSFATSMENLEEALTRWKKLVN